MRRIVFVLLAAGWLLGRTESVRFLRWPEVQPVLAKFATPADKLPEITGAKEGEDWLRQRDAEIRGRIDRAVEDSISALILFGTSFTSLPALAGTSAAVDAAGGLTAPARARVDAILQALDQQDSERLRLALDHLRRRHVPEDEVKAYLIGILRRYALELSDHQHARKGASEAIPAEGSLMAGFAIEEALRNLKGKGAATTHIRRVAVIGPGLDFGGQPDGFDIIPLQTVQPFSVLEAVLRQGLAQPSEVQVTAFDLNPWVLGRIKAAASKARSAEYTLQVGRPSTAQWNGAATGYWQHFGDTIGTPAAAAQAPPGIEHRGILVKPQFAARVAMEELNIVTQTFEAGPAQGFDLVVATNVLDYYNQWEQALALTSIAQMMAKGGILLSNAGASAPKLEEFEPLGTEVVAYKNDGTSESVTVYRRR